LRLLNGDNARAGTARRNGEGRLAGGGIPRHGRDAPSVDVAQIGRAAAKPPKVYPVLILRILQHLLFFNWYENNIVFCLIFHSVTFIFDIMLLILL
jgi:hypothetical protein